MKKILFLLFFLSFTTFIKAQENSRWKGYFSYNEIIDVAAESPNVYAATINAILQNNLSTNNQNIINSINGLKAENITCLHYSPTFNLKIVGNSNGLLLIVKPDGKITEKTAIIEELPVPANTKRINHLMEHDGKLYIAADYGISVLDLSNLEFISTYFIGTNGEETPVYQTTVLNNIIYAVTRDFGIRSADLSNNFLYDFSQWSTLNSGYWNHIIAFNNILYATSVDNTLYQFSGATPVLLLTLPSACLHLKVSQDYLTITCSNWVRVFNTNNGIIATVNNIDNVNSAFTSAITLDNYIIIGTEGDGLQKAALNQINSFETISPNGPLKNAVFRVTKAPTYLWATYGDYTTDYNPYPLDEYGISYFSNDNGWEYHTYEDILEAKSLSGIAVNPANENEVYVASFFSGLLKITPEAFTLYNTTNTGSNGLESVVLNPPNPNYIDIRINTPAFDKEGNLWMTNSLTLKGLKVLKTNGQWQSYNSGALLPQGINQNYATLTIDKNGTKWLPTSYDGLVGFNEKYNNKFIVVNQENSNLPSDRVNVAAPDNSGRLWIGTARGLRVLQSVDRFSSETELNTSNIVIQDGELAQELFYQQTILDIAVDGANNKWVSIADAGVFLVSENGQRTLARFTKSNSPLPSNSVSDIEINSTTGEVYFATDKGLVSYLGTSTKANDDLANLYCYPNPVRPEYTGTVKIAGLTDKANVKIVDIEGNLVFETTSEGGTIEWDTSSFGSYKVASGVYMVFIATKDGLETTVKKIMIIR